MEEIKYKLNTGNTVLIVNAIEKLISVVKSNYKPAERSKFVLENEELKFLREICSSSDFVVSLTAWQGLLALVEEGVLEIASTMSTVIALLPTVKNYSGIISTMTGLLILDLRSRLLPGQVYRSQYSIKSPQHPFITVLEKNTEATCDVLNQIQAICTHSDYIVQSNSVELLRPVFLWLVCASERPERVLAFRLLLSLSDTEVSTQQTIMDCLCWQQTKNAKSIDSTLVIFTAAIESTIQQKEMELIIAMMPALAVLSNQLIRYGRDPRACYNLMKQCFLLNSPELNLIAGLTVALLADNLTVSCALHLYDLFHLCDIIIRKYDVNAISSSIFLSQSLQWLHLPSSLTEKALKIASKLLETAKTQNKKENKIKMSNLLGNTLFMTLQHIDERIVYYLNSIRSLDSSNDNPTELKSWLSNFESIDNRYLFKSAGLFSGLLFDKNTAEEIKLKALEFLLKIADFKNDFAITLLPILIYKVANDTSPIVKLECLHAVPLMAKCKVNVPTIIIFLTELRCDRGPPTSLLISLHSTLTQHQPRCFPHLQQLLADCSLKHHDTRWEVEVARAKAVKKVCELRPTSGVELVPVISSILNRCTDSETALPVALAIEGLLYLWRAGVVAPDSTWKVLQHKLGKDRRPRVQISLCKLLSEVPLLHNKTPEYDKLTESCAAKLWDMVADGSYPEVCEAGCDALANYLIDQYTLKVVPEIYRTTVKLPPSYCKTPEDAARNPADVLDYIPCEIWPEVYKHTPPEALRGVSRLVSKGMEREIRGYRSGVYAGRGGRGEPGDMAYLPPHSVVRGVAEFVKRQATHPTYDCPDSVLLEMLNTLAAEYSKPLPPLDLCFLHELFHKGSLWKEPTLLLAARQAFTSGSANRMIENYLANYDPEKVEESEIIILFKILPQICRTLPPNTVRDPIYKSLVLSYSKLTQNDQAHTKSDEEKPIFIRELELLKVCLESQKIHEANRKLLCGFLENYFLNIEEENEAFDSYISACLLMPQEQIERLSSADAWWDMTPSLSRKCIVLAASHSFEMLLMNYKTVLKTEYEFYLRWLVKALSSRTPDIKMKETLLELMAKLQISFTEDLDQSTKLFYFDIFTISVIVVSGYWTLEGKAFERLPSDRKLRLEMLPAALSSLMKLEEFSTCALQISGWLSHSSVTRLHETVSTACRHSLVILRNYININEFITTR